MSVHSRYRAGLWRPYEKPMYGVLLNPYHPLARGLVGCWLFNECGGNIVYDLSGYGNHGTLGGGTAASCPIWTASKFGSGLEFDGSNDYVEVAHSASLNITDAITIEVRVKLNGYSSDSWGYITCKYTYSTYSLMVGGTTSPGLVRFHIGTDYLESASPYDTLSIDTWYHLVATYNGSSMKLYINGDWNNERDRTGTIPTSTGNLYIGDRCDHDRHFNGIIAKFFLYNRAFSAEEVWQLYTDPFCMFYHPALQAELLYAPAPSAVSTPTLTLLGVGR